jgi:hypothetical protein
MRKLILSLTLGLALSGCAPGLLAGLEGQAPAPLQQTVIDDKGLETAWKAFDLALDALNTLGDLGYIKPGTPTGKAVAAAIRKTNTALAAAERFAAAGSTTDYATALGEASEGITAIRDLIKGSM